MHRLMLSACLKCPSSTLTSHLPPRLLFCSACSAASLQDHHCASPPSLSRNAHDLLKNPQYCTPSRLCSASALMSIISRSLPQLLGGNCTFVIGYDTCLRLLQSKYYLDSTLDSALHSLQASRISISFGCRRALVCDACDAGCRLQFQGRWACGECICIIICDRAAQIGRRSKQVLEVGAPAAHDTCVRRCHVL